MSEGRKDDGGKVRMDLLPPELLHGVAQVLTFGAEKYTWEYETEWDRLLDVQTVTGIKITTQKEDVVSVTKDTLENLVLSSQKDKDKIVGIGKNKILTRLRNTPNVGRVVQELVQETGEPSSSLILKNMDSQKKDTKPSVKKGVKSAEIKNTFILTIVTTQGNFEVSCAPSVITDLDFWETTWKDLKELYSISKPLNQTGERNWEHGMNWSRPFAALMRHMWAWWNPFVPSVDEETGQSHLWHAGCCLAFLIAYEQRGIGNDDRPKSEESKVETRG